MEPYRRSSPALQVAQPPVLTTTLGRGDPSTERVQRGNDQQPYSVDTWQPNTVSLGEEETVGEELTGIESLKDTECHSERVYEVRWAT
jgi:hypothetical protein